ncbi:MAG TPA: monovalent cation/H+ antiporter complex subunit F [bacterium]|nr:monovalent cation/H+ antiporter complex subunit F [bacterium]
MSFLTFITFTLLLISLGSLYRVIFGPTPHDRLVGLNLLVALVTGVMVLLAVLYKRDIYLDVALVYTMLGFISVIAVTKHLKGKGLSE